jgi:hypothetical protein
MQYSWTLSFITVCSCRRLDVKYGASFSRLLVIEQFSHNAISSAIWALSSGKYAERGSFGQSYCWNFVYVAVNGAKDSLHHHVEPTLFVSFVFFSASDCPAPRWRAARPESRNQ